MNFTDEADCILLHDQIFFFSTVMQCMNIHPEYFRETDLGILSDLLRDTAKLIWPEGYQPEPVKRNPFPQELARNEERST